MKLNFKIFKKGKPVYWIVGGIVLFVIFYMITSKGASSSSGGITTINSGPSDTAIAANAQMAMAQLQYGSAVTAQANQANADVAIATLAANTQMAQIAASADAAKYVANLDANTQAQYLTTQRDIASTNAEYSLETARIAADTTLGTYQIQADMFGHQLDTNTEMLQIQSQNLIAQSLIAQIPSLKKGDRDAALISLALGVPSSHGSVKIPSPAGGLLN